MYFDFFFIKWLLYYLLLNSHHTVMQSKNFLFNARTEYYIKKLAPKTVNIVNYNLTQYSLVNPYCI